jgi:hypothetical protein
MRGMHPDALKKNKELEDSFDQLLHRKPEGNVQGAGVPSSLSSSGSTTIHHPSGSSASSSSTNSSVPSSLSGSGKMTTTASFENSPKPSKPPKKKQQQFSEDEPADEEESGSKIGHLRKKSMSKKKGKHKKSKSEVDKKVRNKLLSGYTEYDSGDNDDYVLDKIAAGKSSDATPPMSSLGTMSATKQMHNFMNLDIIMHEYFDKETGTLSISK